MAGADEPTGDLLTQLSARTRDALLLLDPGAEPRFVSDACREMLGAPEGAEGLPALLQRVHSEDRARLEALLAPGDPLHDCLRIRVDAGSDVWRALEARIERSPEGLWVRFLDVVQEVSAPGDTRPPLELIARYLEDVLWLVDPDRQTLLYVSEGYEAMFGRTRATLQTGPRAFYDAVHPADREALRKAALDGLESGWAHEFRVVLPDGSTRWVRQRSVPVRVEGSASPLGVGITQDIDERKRAEEARRASEQRFAVLTGNAFDTLSEVDSQGRTLWTTSSADPPSFVRPEASDGTLQFGVIHDGDRSQVKRSFEAAFERAEPVTLEYRVAGLDGGWHWVETSLNPFVTEQGERRALFVTRDISKRRELVQALADSEERFRLLAENSHDLIAEYDQHAKLLYANQRVLDAEGVRLDECSDISPFDGLHPDDRPNVEARLANLGKTKDPIVLTFRRQHHDGTWRWLESHMHVHLTAAGEPRMVCIARDITERKQAEDRIRASEERYRLLVEGSPEAIVVHSAGRVLYANPAALGLAGADSADDVLGRPLSQWIEASASHQDRVPGLGPERAQYRIRGLDGQVREVLGSDSRITYAGRPAVQTVFRDITEWRRALQERQQLQVQLQESRKLESLGVLAGGIAHDFNNLLAVILGNTRFAQNRLSDAAEAREALEDAVEAAESAARLTRQLLAYAGRRAPEVRPVNLSDHVRSLAGLLQAAVPKKITLHFDLADALPSVRADVVQLEQVTMNLVRNAADAIGEQGGRIDVSTVRVEASAQDLQTWTGSNELAAGEYVVLEVSDTGCGMTDETRQRIFDPFFTTKTEGHGLGLSAVLGLVRGHEGGIAIESAPGNGTSIRVLLPASEAVASDHAPSSAGSASLGATVLVVDDEAGVRRMLRRTLVAHGCSVLEACDGLEAIAAVREAAGTIDVVVLDLNMPKANGEETLAGIRRAAANLPVLLSSGDDHTGVAGRADSDPRTGFLAKPYRDEDLILRLKSLLEATRST
jgi:two-component system cell cycle sensor histidine kinase/response regulator CckA